MTESGPVSTQAAREPSDWHWMWETYVCALCIAAIVAVVLFEPSFGGNVPVACAALAAMAVIVLAFGRKVIRDGDRIAGSARARTAGFLAVVLGLWLTAIVAAAPAVVAIPALYPLIFATLPLAAALALTFLVTLAPLGLAVATHGVSWSSLPEVAAVTLVGAVAAPIIGTTIMTSMRQRQRLAETVAELAASRAETARLSRQAGATGERERLSREIHDTLAQGFTSIVALAQAVQAELDTDRAAAVRHVELIETTARENLAEARIMVADLTPAALGADSLPAAIRRQCQRLTAETGIPVAVHVDDQLPTLGMAGDVVLLRATQETLANIRKHAHASAVSVSLHGDGKKVRLTLSDNGIGLPEDHRDGFGLQGIRARVGEAGGVVTVSSRNGVRIDIEVPA
ncbi:sensor histidine kinase [Mycolicibacterium sp. XJ870]